MRPCNRVSILSLLLCVDTSSLAQSIIDYSLAQRALIESNMAQMMRRTVTPPAIAASGGWAPLATAVSSAAPASAAGIAFTQRIDPEVRVSGVFAMGDRRLAEISVDGLPYFLAEGSSVPGTSWTVNAVSVDRVVLERRASVRSVGALTSAAIRRSYSMPSIR